MRLFTRASSPRLNSDRTASRPAMKCPTGAIRSHVFVLIAVLVWTALLADVESQDPSQQQQGASTLTFVFDVTGSMYDDLVQVIEGAAKILDTVLKRREKPLYNYALVPFHDPEIGPVSITDDPDKFQEELRELYVQGGGDCPEMSVGAIEEALTVSLPGSFIYVFTDARSKDYDRTENVLKLIQEKESQVVFVLTGDCGNQTHPGFQAYEQISSTSSGQVFMLNKSDVDELLLYVEKALQASKVNLVALDNEEANEQVFAIPVDSTLIEMTVSLSGDSPTVELRDPSGKLMTEENGLIKLLDLENGYIVSVEDPIPGYWQLTVSSSSHHSLRVTGVSPLLFTHGFSRKKTNNWLETSRRPISGVDTYLLLNATGLDETGLLNDLDLPEGIGFFSNLELVGLQGDVVAEFPLTRDASDTNRYSVPPFMPPDQYFYLKVTGVDASGYVFWRITSTALSPIIPDITAFMPKRTVGHYNQQASLTCQVDSLLPFTVQWVRNAKHLSTSAQYSETSNVTYNLGVVNTFSEGYYECIASHAKATDRARTFLDITEPLPTIARTQNISALPNTDVLLQCNVYSTVTYNLTWAKPDGKVALYRHPRIQHFANQSMEIRRVLATDSGQYQCVAANEGGVTYASIFLIVQEKPTVYVNTGNISFETGQNISIACWARGIPKPRLYWTKDNLLLQETRTTFISVNGELTILNAKQENQGVYACIGSNNAGTDSEMINIRYIERPRIELRERQLLVANGKTALLVCPAYGIPQPVVSWVKDGKLIPTEYNYIQQSQIRGELRVTNVQDQDAGTYTCIATNEAGDATDSIYLNVGDVARIIQGPSSTRIDIGENATFPCNAYGIPTPSIRWEKGNGESLESNPRFQILATGSLFIQNLQIEDEGTYKCIAENKFGKEEKLGDLIITGLVPPVIAYSNPDIAGNWGNDITLTCLVLMGNPRPNQMWLKDGEPLYLGDESKYVMDYDGHLTIKTLAVEDEGRFTCVANNVAGNNSFTTALTVRVPPTFRDSRTNYTADKDVSVTLYCPALGRPTPRITWKKDGADISANNPYYFFTDAGYIQIVSPQDGDTGVYTCTAINPAGQVSKDLYLFVRVPPTRIDGIDDEYSVSVDYPVELPCAVESIPPPTFSWLKNGQPIETSSGHSTVLADGSLHISRTVIEDGGRYTCVATNPAGNTTLDIFLSIDIPPTILDGPSEFTVILGNPTLLPCEAVGEPNPAIKWYREGVNILFNLEKYQLLDSGSLQILASNHDDTGLYTCVASNNAGEDSRKISLNVFEPPETGVVPHNITVLPGNHIQLACPAKGTPPPKITWLKDNQLVVLDERVILNEDGTLVIYNAKYSDSAHYTCVATNQVGNSTLDVSVKVHVPPSIVEGPEHIQVIMGDPITLPCEANGDPRPEVTWKRNNLKVPVDGQAIQLLPTGSLFIDRVQRIDDGIYHCAAISVAGTANRYITLDVLVPPIIGPGPEIIDGLPDDRLTIPCLASGDPKPEVTWYKDGEELMEITAEHMILNDGSLMIFSAKYENTGLYVCLAENDAGKVNKTFDVFVPLAPTIKKGLNEVSVLVGEEVLMLCEAEGDPEPLITWSKDGLPLSFDDQVMTQSGESSLRIQSVILSHGGMYRCLATNIAGEDSRYIMLKVRQKPKIDDPNQKEQVIEGSSKRLLCDILVGSPLPKVNWYRPDGSLITRFDPNFRIDVDNSLTFLNPMHKDSGNYTCFAQNQVGSDNKTIELIVDVLPQIDQNVTEVVVTTGDSILIPCVASGFPFPDVFWKKDNQEILIDGQAVQKRPIGSLYIETARLTDSGSYTCTAKNREGDAYKKITVIVQEPPSISKPKNVTEVTDQDVLLQCLATGTPRPKVSWLKDGKPITTGKNIEVFRDGEPITTGSNMEVLDDGRLLIHRVTPNDTAKYSCIVENAAGKETADIFVKVLEPPSIKESPESIQVVVGNPVVLPCEAIGDPQPKVTWRKESRTLTLGGQAIKLLESGSLRIHSTRDIDTGMYICEAINEAGVAYKTVTLKVYEHPAILYPEEFPREFTAPLRSQVKLPCPTSGIPTPSIQWLKDGQPVAEDRRGILVLYDGSLLIDDLMRTDTGQYMCWASNVVGNASLILGLTIHVKPEIPNSGSPIVVVVVVGQPLSLDCHVSEGVPPPQIAWYKNGYRLQNSDGAPEPQDTFDIAAVDVSDRGRYVCHAINSIGNATKYFDVSVHVPPSIEDSDTSKSVTVLVNTSLSLYCETLGIPSPSIVWYKDGSPLEASSSAEVYNNGALLHLPFMEVSHAGDYKCVASNDAGNSSKTYIVDVHVPPRITGSQFPVEIVAILNQMVELHCPASAIPPPKITWYKENVVIAHDQAGLKVMHHGKVLRIHSAQLSDRGNFHCVAENVAGNHTRVFNLDVHVYPEIADGETEFVVNQGSHVILPCEVSGIPFPSVAWRKDNSYLPPDGNAYRQLVTGSLELTSVSITDTGRYQCFVRNPAGNVSRTITLEVQVPPTILSTTDMESVVVNNVVILPCEVMGLPQPRVIWQHGHEVIEPETNTGYTILDEGSLMIERAQLSDAGRYTCVARNVAGSQSKQITLQVYIQPYVSVPLKMVNATENLSVLLQCMATGVPQPHISWRKQSSLITDNDIHYHVQSDGSLKIPVVRSEDTGYFTCTADNVAGKDKAEIMLIVNVPPVITPMENQIAIKGSSVNIMCHAQGIPKPTVVWEKDGFRLLESENAFFVSDHHLRLLDVDFEDQGLYICYVDNIAGQASESMTLTIFEKPHSLSIIPTDLEVKVNERLLLECTSGGFPPPTIIWKHDGTEIARSEGGSGQLVIENARKQDEGSYICVAENQAGTSQFVTTVKINVPPLIDNFLPPNGEFKEHTENLLPCGVIGDPKPLVTWKHNGLPVEYSDRIILLEDNSLLITDVRVEDAGSWMCLATNNNGQVGEVVEITILGSPQFTIRPPLVEQVNQGDGVLLDCQASAKPSPSITWTKGLSLIVGGGDGIVIMANNSLRIPMAQLQHTGRYYCHASNDNGNISAYTDLTVRVHGGWSEWSEWGPCSETCARGTQQRRRACNNPPPANGGDSCVGSLRDSKACYPGSCPVDGQWGPWSIWEPCSRTCGEGNSSRTRQCNNPPPQFGGSYCEGPARETFVCNIGDCPVDGNWGRWSSWSSCSTSCGKGRQDRSRRCDNPSPSYSPRGRLCLGLEAETRSCQTTECPVNGGWSQWSVWGQCSMSCNGGTQQRHRDCSKPVPQYDGLYCEGISVQTQPCNIEGCPINGGWSIWTDWSTCSQSCGGGGQSRYRFCNNPVPRNGGKSCMGKDKEMQSCNEQCCSEDGGWSGWYEWSICSQECGGGYSERRRVCDNPPPLCGGSTCLGYDSQRKRCNLEPCQLDTMDEAIGQVFGTINGVDFGPSILFTNLTKEGEYQFITGSLHSIGRDLGFSMRTLLSLISPIYWTLAYEIDEAVNGYSLTEGHFTRLSQVEFTTGEVVKMEHIARGLDSRGALSLTIAVDGQVPVVPEGTQVILKDYSEDYVQTGPGQLYAYSTRMFRMGSYSLPFAWNHTITYDPALGYMPFLVETLHAVDVDTSYDPLRETLHFQISATIEKGEDSNQCPAGFYLSLDGLYCSDDDECTRENVCSHSCLNTPGSFTCACPYGMMLGPDGRTCKDMDECLYDNGGCPEDMNCVNTVGSFKCSPRCLRGFKLIEDENICRDVNECLRSQTPCDHQCENTVGSYRCSCKRGYTKKGRNSCVDIDECSVAEFPCDDGKECKNEEGSFQCTMVCDSGYELSVNGTTCVDINECQSGRSRCGPDQICRNMMGRYACLCPRGLRAEGTQCIDIDECMRNPGPCSYQCINTRGSFECICAAGQQRDQDKITCRGLIPDPNQEQQQSIVTATPPPTVQCDVGLRSVNGRCQDIDECAENRQICANDCHNVLGSYFCTCPPGYKLGADQRTCEDVDECGSTYNVGCGTERSCFNKLGSYECINTPCPQGFHRDYHGSCTYQCPYINYQCPGMGRIYEYRTLALPYGVAANQDLLILRTVTPDGRTHPYSRYTIVENKAGMYTCDYVPFAIRCDSQGRGILYTLEPLHEVNTYEITIQAVGYNNRYMDYDTTFVIFISVSPYPY